MVLAPPSHPSSPQGPSALSPRVAPATGLAAATVSGVPTVRGMQGDLIRALASVCAAKGAGLYIADIVTSPRPVLWVCGTPAHYGAIVEALRKSGLQVVGLHRGKRVRLAEKMMPPLTAAVFCSLHKDGHIVHGVSSGIEVEFCAWLPDRMSWRAARAGVESETLDADLRDAATFDLEGTVLPILGNTHAIWHQHPAARGVDIVYTWVDGSDPAWRARKQAALSEEATANGSISGSRYGDEDGTKLGANLGGDIHEANSPARFVSGPELAFSILSAERYFKGLRHIYVVTDRQRPDLTKALPADVAARLMARITIVDHADIFEAGALRPTFNSHVIESQLHRIPGLSAHYLYMNDDFFFARATCGNTFFDAYGRSRQFPSGWTAVPASRIGVRESAVDAAARNNRRLLADKFGIYAYKKFMHAPVAIERQVMEQMECDLRPAWEATLPNRLRSAHDHSISGHLYFHYAAFKGRSVTGRLRYCYLDLAAPDFAKTVDKVLADDWQRVDCFCVNEGETSEHTSTNRAIMDARLARWFPCRDVIRGKPADPRKVLRKLPGDADEKPKSKTFKPSGKKAQANMPSKVEAKPVSGAGSGAKFGRDEDTGKTAVSAPFRRRLKRLWRVFRGS